MVCLDSSQSKCFSMVMVRLGENLGAYIYIYRVNYNIIISYCTLFREKWEILANLVSLDLLVLMVSL